ncbi:hypothetical protein CC86DRAFT_314204 [Ophiobolus disseminans]|uniref:DUF7896 domain-containing protein n=1 Tax=Ophiobolus disseminans TaxID=1469910 RepID=A0A6A7ACM2_9PLEO|nr:hypothetical protein CC86DRAFT_314204 [Ophiobolus disseminans]
MASTLFDRGSTLYQQLERTRQDFWCSHAHLTEEQRQHFWSQAASCSNNAYGTSHDSMVQQTPRSMISMSSMTQLPTPDYGSMDRTYSAPMMGRSISSTGSDSNTMQRSTSAWQSMPQEPANDYVLFSDAPMRHQQALQPIAEVSYSNNMTEWSPDDYINNCINTANPSSLSSSLPLHSHQLQLTPNLQQWSPSSESSTAPSTPSTALMTPLTHSSNPMSRQSSYNPHFLEDTSMLRIQSDSSYVMPILPEDGSISYDSFNVDSKSIVDTSSFPTFTGSTSETFLSSTQSVLSSAHALASENDMSYLAEDMWRSTSTTSSEGNLSDASASSSTCTRQSRRDREINALAAARKIAPKAIESNDEAESSPSNAQMAEIRSQDGSSKTVGILTKTPYVRPQHPKIRCEFCNERPEGFRGTHELDRHIQRAHAKTRKGYICIDYSDNKKFLANCKHCRNKKIYGAYYNAAAHLRRAHFHPRKRGRKGKNDEKRGGIGGGDHPPMDHLKMHWIKEVEIVDNKMPSSPESADDTADPLYESTFDIDTAFPNAQQQPMPSSSINTQLPIDPTQYVDYGMSMNASENMMYVADNFAYDNDVAPANDMSSFQFDAYM